MLCSFSSAPTPEWAGNDIFSCPCVTPKPHCAARCYHFLGVRLSSQRRSCLSARVKYSGNQAARKSHMQCPSCELINHKFCTQKITKFICCKDKCLNTFYIHNTTQYQQHRFTIAEVADEWHELYRNRTIHGWYCNNCSTFIYLFILFYLFAQWQVQYLTFTVISHHMRLFIARR